MPKKRDPRAEARDNGATIYYYPCPTHGWGPHWTALGTCARCDKSNPAYKFSTCVDHGRTIGWGRSEGVRCLSCFTAAGELREAKPLKWSRGARRVAWGAKERFYVDRCLVHGFVAHHTCNGLCASCYTKAGRPIRYGVG